jgi:hypothetical protein
MVRIARTVPHPEADIAIIELAEEAGTPGLNTLGGIAFRDPTWADRAHVFGYPPVATTNDQYLVDQAGEVVNPAVICRKSQWAEDVADLPEQRREASPLMVSDIFSTRLQRGQVTAAALSSRKTGV